MLTPTPHVPCSLLSRAPLSQELLSRVKDDDYVVDPHVLECVHSLLDISAAPDAEEEPITQQDTARMLTDGFKGYGRMYRLLQGWMAEVCAPMAGESPTSRPAEVGAAVAGELWSPLQVAWSRAC